MGSPRKKRKKEKNRRKRLRFEFEKLPVPNYEYKVALPKIPDKGFVSDRLLVMDRADRDEMEQKEREKEFEEMMLKQSLVIQKGLPRPKRVNEEMKYDERESAESELL